MDKFELQHRNNTAKYSREIEKIYDLAIREAAAIGADVSNFDPSKPFTFKDYPQTKARINSLTKKLQKDLDEKLKGFIKKEFALSNEKNDNMLAHYFAGIQLTQAQQRQYYSNTLQAQQAFINRKINGLNLSDRVWKYTNQFKEEIEMGLDLGIRDGMSAPQIARSIKQYLQQPDKLFRRVRDEHGQLHLSKAAKAYNPGAGIYRSSYKNAMRLARTETNIAYRSNDYERWKKFDFILGVKIQLSNNHPIEDICDELHGDYPKDFKFTGWHPQCLCFVTSILMNSDDYWENEARMKRGEKPIYKGEIKDVPDNFKKWVENNRDRIDKAVERGKLPYFLRDNEKYVNAALAHEADVAKYNSYGDELKKSYFDEKSGGYLVVDKQRIEQGNINKWEKAKYDKEYNMCMNLAQNGYKIEYLKMTDGSFDIYLNGVSADLKQTSSHNNILSYAKKATHEQGAKLVIFEFTKETKSIYEQLELLKTLDIHGKYYFTGKGKSIYIF